MNRLPRVLHTLSLCVAFLFVAAVGYAQVELRFSPQDTTLDVGDAARLSIMLNDAIDVRTIEVTVEYDPEVLESAGGESGQGFLDTSCPLFDGFDDSTPGIWQAYVVVLGAECWLTGPAELIAWDFTALAPGISAITAVDVTLYAPQSGEIEGVSLPPTSVSVQDSVTAVYNLPEPNNRLRVCPNPFNPRLTVSFTVPRTEQVRIGVYDVTGRPVRALADRVFSTGEHSVVWHGCNADGRAMPSGTYLVRLKTESGLQARKSMLVR